MVRYNSVFKKKNICVYFAKFVEPAHIDLIYQPRSAYLSQRSYFAGVSVEIALKNTMKQQESFVAVMK